MPDMDVPVSLRRWFVAHCVVDLAIGVPLLLAPGLFLGSLGWRCVDPVTARLAGAALLAIGGQSLIARQDGPEIFKLLLNLKLIWSYAAIVGLVVAVGQGAPPAAWALLSALIAFAGVWTHYRIRFKQLAAAADLPEDPGELPGEQQE
jgi:hypothetical protein